MIAQYSPKIKMTFYTQQGEVIDVTDNDLLHAQVQTNVDAPTGMWSCLLTGRRVRGKGFDQRIAAMDYVEIEIARIPSAGGLLTIAMRGFVDNCHLNQDPYTRRVQVNGRNFGKLWLKYQVYFLSEIDPAASLIPGARLEVNFGIPAGIITPKTFAQLITDRIVAPNLDQLQRENPAIPGMQLQVDVPDQYAVNGFSIQPFTGSVWNLLNQYANKPWIETFIIDTRTGPRLLYRLAPYKDITGAYLNLQGLAPTHHVIRNADIISASWGTSDNEVYTYYFTYPVYAYIDRTAFKGEGINLNLQNPYVDTARIKKYGFLPLECSASMIPSLNAEPAATSAQQKPEVLRLAAELNQWNIKAFSNNADYLNGQIELKGGGDIQPGEYLTLTDQGCEFYVNRVEHTFDVSGDPLFQTTCGVVRGRKT